MIVEIALAFWGLIERLFLSPEWDRIFSRCHALGQPIKVDRLALAHIPTAIRARTIRKTASHLNFN
ncbi:hypothetical protein Metme_0244 [Methylomonas methanica MC09]|uniref:Uncharacterized protein n=1 Tax=Methylomonas methanica (strain DSM 25384 / MC09) TaxID=857087 RepID=F9ZZN4_METMM|nr:hypothetical protein Metme_0244 [Methylomonas methanica MC09]